MDQNTSSIYPPRRDKSDDDYTLSQYTLSLWDQHRYSHLVSPHYHRDTPDYGGTLFPDYL